MNKAKQKWGVSPAFRLDGPLTIRHGDIDSNGIVNTTDLVEITRIINGINIPTRQQKLNADINQDDLIDETDLNLLLDMTTNG